jgi:hypothetical protein
MELPDNYACTIKIPRIVDLSMSLLYKVNLDRCIFFSFDEYIVFAKLSAPG